MHVGNLSWGHPPVRCCHAIRSAVFRDRDFCFCALGSLSEGFFYVDNINLCSPPNNETGYL